jgi:hypothetical protein
VRKRYKSLRKRRAHILKSLLAELAQERLARFVFAWRHSGLAVLDHASNRRRGEDLVTYDDRDGPVHVRPRKILETLSRLGRELDRQPTAARVPVNLRFAFDQERREVRRVEHNVLAIVLPDDKILRLRVVFLDRIDAVRERPILGHQSAA